MLAHFARLKMATSFLPIALASLNPSEKRITSAICSLSGFDMAINRPKQLLEVVWELLSSSVPLSSRVHGDEYTRVGVQVDLVGEMGGVRCVCARCDVTE